MSVYYITFKFVDYGGSQMPLIGRIKFIILARSGSCSCITRDVEGEDKLKFYF